MKKLSFKIGDPRLYQAVRRLKKLDLYERVCDFLESPVIESAIEKEFKKS